MFSHEKIAKILRADKDTILGIETKLSAKTGKKNVIHKIVDENEEMIRNRLGILGVSREAVAKEVFDALISKIESDNHHFYGILGSPSMETKEGCMVIVNAVRTLTGEKKGFFLKKEKALELLHKNPPEKIISAMGCEDINELLEKEDWIEVFCALRFLEDKDWLNDVFFKEYESLTPDDFEERPIEVRVLGNEWTATAEAFVQKKYHNISHLKELGVVFIIHKCLGISGELIRNFTLVLHYLNEIPFYSEILKKQALVRETFAKNMISLLRGDVIDKRLPASKKSLWLVIQRYLAKDDENDWRLSEPHVNPEAMHWKKAETTLVKAGDKFNHFGVDLAFWQNLDWVGDYFLTNTGIEVLVSFNLIDTEMSLVKEKDLVKYLYHHEESLWNKIFSEYFGEEKLEETIKENLLKGWFEV